MVVPTASFPHEHLRVLVRHASDSLLRSLRPAGWPVGAVKATRCPGVAVSATLTCTREVHCVGVIFGVEADWTASATVGSVDSMGCMLTPDSINGTIGIMAIKSTGPVDDEPTFVLNTWDSKPELTDPKGLHMDMRPPPRKKCPRDTNLITHG